MEHGSNGMNHQKHANGGDEVFGLEKIAAMEKLVTHLQEKVESLEAEVGVLRNEVKQLRSKI